MAPRTHSHPRCRALLGILLYDEDSVRWVEARPREAEIEANTHREADTARATFAFEALPMDVRLIRSVWVGLWLGDVGSADQEIALDDERFQAFVGYADEPETSQDADGEWVTLSCRDYTGLLLDTPWPGGFLDIQRPLSQVVDEVLSLVPGAARMQTVYADGVEGLDLSAQLGRTVWTPEDGDDVWTVLVTLLGQVGLLPVVRLDTLRVETAATFGVRSAAFTYGVNVRQLRTRRQLSRAANAAVQVTAYNEATGQVQTVTYPSAVASSPAVAVDGSVVQGVTTVMPYVLAGSYGQGDLEAIAQRIYDQEARQAVEGTLVTRDLWDESDETRLPLLANGDRLTVRQSDPLGASIRGMSEAEAIAYLTNKADPLDRPAAEALVAAQKAAEGLAVEFYVKRARHSWSARDGYELTVDFVNYVGGSDGG